MKKRKGYIYVEVEESVRVDISDIIDEIDDDDLVYEVKKRKLLGEYDKQIPTEGIKLKEMLCDLCDLSHHSSVTVILNEIEQRLK